MADTQLHSMTEATSLGDSDEMYAVVSPYSAGNDRRISIANLRTTILSSIRGYSIQIGAYNFNPADATTYYWGGLFPAAPGTTDGTRRIYIPRGGTLKRIYLTFTCAPGSSETSTLYVRVNSTTDYTISSTFALDANPKIAFNTSLSIPLSTGDYIEIKWITPTWATNPTAVSVNAIAWIE